MKTHLIALTAALATALVAAAPAGAERGSWNNWHVHNGTAVPYTDANGLTHRGAAFFPGILTGGDLAAYVGNPDLWAYCADATDKVFAGRDGDVDGSKQAAGMCQNGDNVIHLLSVPAGQSPPDGWSRVIGTSSVYYKLTPRG